MPLVEITEMETVILNGLRDGLKEPTGFVRFDWNDKEIIIQDSRTKKYPRQLFHSIDQTKLNIPN